MEDPITFDVWCRIRPGFRDLASQAIDVFRSDVPRIERIRMIVRSQSLCEPILCGVGLSWSTVQERKKSLGAIADDIRTFQSGYGPPDTPRLAHCPDHDLYYAGVLGCPLCSGRAQL